MAVLEFQSNPDLEPWEVPELDESQRRDIRETNFLRSVDPDSSNSSNDFDSPFSRMSTWRQSLSAAVGIGGGKNKNKNKQPRQSSPERLAQFDLKIRTKLEEAFRAPVVLAYNVRKEIMKQRDGKWVKRAAFHHPCNEELKMMDLVGDFLKAFEGLKKFMTNPVPFPLVQMAKTFLFAWLFTLPLALNHDTFASPWMPLVLVFLITFGFVGMEETAMQLSDSFGEDPVDFDNLGYAQIIFEDCYIAVSKIDGPAAARELRKKVLGRMTAGGNALQQFQTDYQKDWDSENEDSEGWLSELQTLDELQEVDEEEEAEGEQQEQH